jgi:hypothetical protein
VISRVLVFAYFLEAGLALLVVPWTVFWERNWFIEGTLLGPVLMHHAVRGAISGVGAICLVAAVAELWDCRPWKPAPAPAPVGPSPSGVLDP